MDLQGVGAIAAAVVAAVGVPTALVVGRWQMKAAIHAAEESSRAGFAQAESSYRAALDAVRAEAVNAHSQWRRGLRRDAYAALLLAAHQARTAGRLLTEGSIEDRVSRGVFTTQRAALAEARVATQKAALVVALEGPEQPAIKAEALAHSCQRFIDVHGLRAEADEAGHSIRTARAGLAVDDPLSEFVEAMDVVTAQIYVYPDDPAALEAELQVRSSPSQIRDLRDAAFAKLMQIPESLRKQGLTYLFASLRHPDLVREERQGSDAQFLEDQEELLAAARAVLDGDSTSQ
ncbi:hypothetical protein ACFVJ4_03045 [Streptomyces sp. NPDC127178]|uniref:hypothetical protein n=1 Tax=unclassified Streptomyces TaxID=2593676 RepID=UPI00363FC2D9